jgi:hypothetical protein
METALREIGLKEVFMMQFNEVIQFMFMLGLLMIASFLIGYAIGRPAKKQEDERYGPLDDIELEFVGSYDGTPITKPVEIPPIKPEEPKILTVKEKAINAADDQIVNKFYD